MKPNRRAVAPLVSWALIVALLGTAPAGCAQGPAPDPAGAPIIVKYQGGARTLDRLNGLFAAEGVRLRPERRMSGGAEVWRVQGLRDPARLQDVLERLNAQPEVQYAEHDRVMRIQ